MKRPPTGLTAPEVDRWRSQAGPNVPVQPDRAGLVARLRGIASEPMFVLLLVTALLYAALGDRPNALLMLGALLAVAGISYYQERRADQALEALRQLTAPQATVLRDGERVTIPAPEVVLHDVLLLSEGEPVAADALLLSVHDFSVNESLLTGEALPVEKVPGESVFGGTSVATGWAYAEVSAVGTRTRLGAVGATLGAIEQPETPLQRQVKQFVRAMATVGVGVLVLFVVYRVARSGEFWPSLLQGLTVAMAILPEEIPVALSSFMALGAWRMARQRMLVRQPQTVEALGSATVICLDKTGTLTQNRMRVVEVLPLAPGVSAERVLAFGFWASEPLPTDPMEVAIHEARAERQPGDSPPDFDLIREYPIAGRPPMMTHVQRNAETGERVIAAKGAPEKILAVCKAGPEVETEVLGAVERLAAQGYRVLGVAEGTWPDGEAFPENQEAFFWKSLGLLALSDPPKPGIERVIADFRRAGIGVKMLTGDNPLTAKAIARQVGIAAVSAPVLGEAVMRASDDELRQLIGPTTVFARMFPEAKLRVVEALKANGETVAMTGDGVNDGPALKAAHIGVAMGARGTEIARQAAALILEDDDLAGMTAAIADGRTTYLNLKKAIRYIVSIHLPLIAIVLLLPLFGWPQTAMVFLPVHVIFFELVMGPTCSIAYEAEPPEHSVMRPLKKRPRTLFTRAEVLVSLLQGAVLTLGAVVLAWYGVAEGWETAGIRSALFLMLALASILLSFSNRSFAAPLWRRPLFGNPRISWVAGLTLLFTAFALYTPVGRQVFGLTLPTPTQALLAAVTAGVGTLWIELFKRGSRLSR